MNGGVGLGLELTRKEPAVGFDQLDDGLPPSKDTPMPFSARGVRTTFAPSIRISLRRSIEKLSAIVTTNGYPFCAQTMASPIPVLPLVASTTVWPGLRAPLRSPSSMMLSASRSLTEAAGLKNSAFT